MTRIAILCLMVAAAAFLGLAGLRVRREHRTDAILLCGAAILLLGHVVFWQISPFGITGLFPRALWPLVAGVSMLFQPSLVYLAGIVLGIRFFFTPVRGWPRAAFLLTGIAMLSPLIFLFVILPIAFLVG